MSTLFDCIILLIKLHPPATITKLQSLSLPTFLLTLTNFCLADLVGEIYLNERYQ